jgi:hypothetical protein
MNKSEFVFRIILAAAIGVAVGVVLFKVIPQAQGQETIGVWSGCCETLYILDPQTGMARKFERREDIRTTKDMRIGTGNFAQWEEAYCQLPGAPSWGWLQKDWPKPVADAEMQRLLGPTFYRYFAERPKAEMSRVYNLSPYEDRSTWGPTWKQQEQTWRTLPWVANNVTPKLPRPEENTGRLDANGNVEIYVYNNGNSTMRPGPKSQVTPPPAGIKPAASKIPLHEQCGSCGGSGALAHPLIARGMPGHLIVCPTCGGRGRVVR